MCHSVRVGQQKYLASTDHARGSDTEGPAVVDDAHTWVVLQRVLHGHGLAIINNDDATRRRIKKINLC